VVRKGGVRVPREKRTVEEFDKEIESYFKTCQEEGIFPDEAGLILFLGLEQEEYRRLREGKRGKGYAAAISRARLRRESIIVRELYNTEKAATGKIFVARQPENGGLTDKHKEAAAPVTVKVRLAGAGENPFD
jgi:triphosphoribosyl-dephospho-CoA synthetase